MTSDVYSILPEKVVTETSPDGASVALHLARNDALDEVFHMDDILLLDRNEVVHELARRGRLSDDILVEIACDERLVNKEGETVLYSLLRSGNLPTCLKSDEILDLDDGLPRKYLERGEREHPDDILKRRILDMTAALSRFADADDRNIPPRSTKILGRLEKLACLVKSKQFDDAVGSRFQMYFFDHLLSILCVAMETSVVGSKAAELGYETNIPSEEESKRMLEAAIEDGRYGDAAEHRDNLARAVGRGDTEKFENKLLEKKVRCLEKERLELAKKVL